MNCIYWIHYVKWLFVWVKVVAIETFDSSHVGRFEFTIELINWNDELPIFDQAEYEIHINETTPMNVDLIRIKASDRDIGDDVMLVIF